MRIICVTAFILISLSFNVTAETFSVSVGVTKKAQPLTIKQKKAMKLPRVKVDKRISNGTAVCDSAGNQLISSRYCRGNSENGIYEVSGRANATVTVLLPILHNDRSGLRLDLYTAGTRVRTKQLTLNHKGNATIEITGVLTVEDVNSVNTGSQVFDIDIQASYN